MKVLNLFKLKYFCISIIVSSTHSCYSQEFLIHSHLNTAGEEVKKISKE